MKIKLRLIGCDDTTYIEMEINNDEKKLIDKLVKLSQENSEYVCQPIMKYDIIE